jgi:hypothetical protein
MPDREAMRATQYTWSDAWGAWKYHRARCTTCQQCTCEPLNPVELCPGGAELHAELVAAHAAYDTAATKPTGWRY